MTRLSRVGAAEATNCLGVGSSGNRCLNFSDPFGDSTLVNCREVGGHGKSGVVGHCAIRVMDKKRGIDVTIELIPDHLKNRIRRSNPGSAEERAYDPSGWVRVAEPEHVSMQQFDDAVLGASKTVEEQVTGSSYHFDGSRNSNHFVYAVISMAGGRVPRSPSFGFTFGAP